MEKSKRYNTVSKWYTSGMFSEDAAKKMVYNAVRKGWITAEEYKEITGGVMTEKDLFAIKDASQKQEALKIF